MATRLAVALSSVLASAGLPALAAVTPIAEAQRGAAVTVVGTVERLLDGDEFRLVDATGSLLVYVGPHRVPVGVGERVTVTGVMDDDPGPAELYARAITRADGTVVALPPADD